jgi:hypothetical protein
VTGGDFLRPDFANWSLAEGRNRFAKQPTQLLDRHLLDVVLPRYTSTSSATVSDLESRRARYSRSSSRSKASAASCSEANPPRCTRFASRPPSRYRYDHSGSPSRPVLFSRIT